MVRIGLISEQQQKSKKRFFGEYSKEFVVNDANPFELVVLTVPFDRTKIEGMKDRHKEKMIVKCLSVLEKSGVDRIIFSPFMKPEYTPSALNSNSRVIFSPRASSISSIPIPDPHSTSTHLPTREGLDTLSSCVLTWVEPEA